MQDLGRTISLCELSNVVNEKSIHKMQRSVIRAVGGSRQHISCSFFVATHTLTSAQLWLSNCVLGPCVCVCLSWQRHVSPFIKRKSFFSFSVQTQNFPCAKSTLFLFARALNLLPDLFFPFHFYSLLLCTAFFFSAFISAVKCHWAKRGKWGRGSLGEGARKSASNENIGRKKCINDSFLCCFSIPVWVCVAFCTRTQSVRLQFVFGFVWDTTSCAGGGQRGECGENKKWSLAHQAIQ